MKTYGKELILDLHDCDPYSFTRKQLTKFFKLLCKELDMERGQLNFWDYKGYPEEKAKAPPHLKGTSAVQFISTSSIVIHTLDTMRRVYLDIFSCKEFDNEKVIRFSTMWFNGRVVKSTVIDRM